MIDTMVFLATPDGSAATEYTGSFGLGRSTGVLISCQAVTIDATAHPQLEFQLQFSLDNVAFGDVGTALVIDATERNIATIITDVAGTFVRLRMTYGADGASAITFRIVATPAPRSQPPTLPTTLRGQLTPDGRSMTQMLRSAGAEGLLRSFRVGPAADMAAGRTQDPLWIRALGEV